MFTFGITAFIICGLITNTASTVMKIRVNEKLPKSDRFSWWARYYSAVGEKYREFYPDSFLPDLTRYSYWICIFLFVAVVMISFFQR